MQRTRDFGISYKFYLDSARTMDEIEKLYDLRDCITNWGIIAKQHNDVTTVKRESESILNPEET